MSIDVFNATTYGEVAVVRCNQGFKPRGSWTVKCEASGNWNLTHVSKCELIDCDDPTPVRGRVNTSETVLNTVVNVSCEEGYELSGSRVIICQEDGTWSGKAICDPLDCGMLQVSNADVVTYNGTSLGSVARITCNAGFVIQGPTSVECMAPYGWSATVSCILIECPRFHLNNGHVFGNNTTYGASLELNCDSGYTLIGGNRVTCQDNRQWSENSTCVIKDCGTVTAPTHGKILNIPIVTTFKSEILFDCDYGYLLQGIDSIQCDSIGLWTSAPPICIKKSELGGTCTNKRQCLAENAICEDSKCACTSCVFDNKTNKCDTMPLMPFGTDAGDMLLDKPDCSGPIVFKPTIPVFKKMRDTMHVCKSGLVSFDKKYVNPKPAILKDENRIVFESAIDIKDPVVAAYFSHIYLDKASSIHYRTYDILNDYPFTSKANNEIRYLENVIKQIENISSFDANFVLIATWNRVKPRSFIFDRTRSATFQLVIISSGELTFAMHIYGHEQMNWTLSHTTSSAYPAAIPLWIGHSDIKGPRFNHFFSFKTLALRMDMGTRSGGISGLLLKNIGSTNASLSNHAVDCILWFNKNRKNKEDFHTYSQRLPNCPCDVSLAQWDPWFWAIRRSIRRNTDNDILCVDMQFGEPYKPYGKSCCYYRTTLTFIDERPLAGGFYIRHPTASARDHEIEDIIAKDKCCNKSDHCDLYYQLHPPGTCYRASPYNLGSFWGDPHIRTLDATNYTFNGLGEYVLLSIDAPNVTFSLQARTERAMKKDGNLSEATIFTAFAAKDHLNSSIHVELNTDKDEITLNIGVGAEMLSLDTIIPKTFQNKTRGLLGNNDGNQNNDFVYPNGSVLRADASDAEIFLFGQSWAVNDNTSVFFYEDGKRHADYHNASYVPRFLDTVDNETLAKAIHACNGSVNVECVYDYAFTLNIEVAENTNNKRQNVDMIQTEIAMVMPI
ncbi:mucin-like protein isoform X1 [Dreissena polymorpha]|nr:mucin-like protein isoform X1 [Dreissena polymorpha]XP_052243010.1 mucin-like protein isoform X1 [Dreissena polymorpha]